MATQNKLTYTQNWPAYNKSQLNEKLFFMRLLEDLCSQVEQPKYNFGRPQLPYSDMIFGIAIKIYTTFSYRRFMSDMKIAKRLKFVEKVPCYSSLSNFMNKRELTALLKKLIRLSSSPLKEVEEHFALDSSGFSTSRFGRWSDSKWGKERKYKIWLKAHLSSGVKTNIVTGASITKGRRHDIKELPTLIRQTAENFNLKKVSCDKAYLSKKSLELISKQNATPFIPFKSNVRGRARGSGIWKKMFLYFTYNQEEFMKHYHKRSNAETVFHMLKTKFGGNIKSKKYRAQINEVLCKILCHNICVVIQEINELGITTEIIAHKKLSV
jgi:transposase